MKNQPVIHTARAAVDLSACRSHIVRLTGADQLVDIASLATHSSIFGILDGAPNSGQQCGVQMGGIAPVVAGAAITVNVLITTNGSGRAVAAASGDWVIGRALVAAVNDGDVISAIVHPPFRVGQIN